MQPPKLKAVDISAGGTLGGWKRQPGALSAGAGVYSTKVMVKGTEQKQLVTACSDPWSSDGACGTRCGMRSCCFTAGCIRSMRENLGSLQRCTARTVGLSSGCFRQLVQKKGRTLNLPKPKESRCFLSTLLRLQRYAGHASV